ncbi:MAG: VOC family protein [Flavobacteriaceae bacterium]
MESIAPNIFVFDIKETISFYENLGFQIQAKNPDNENPVFVLMTCGKVSVMFQSFESLGDQLPVVKREKGSSLLLYIQLKNIEEFYNVIKDQVEVYRELEKTFYDATEFSIIDNNDYILTFAEQSEN